VHRAGDWVQEVRVTGSVVSVTARGANGMACEHRKADGAVVEVRGRVPWSDRTGERER
jgi:hypothetical protein